MKKLIVVVISLFLFVLLTACNEATTIETTVATTTTEATTTTTETTTTEATTTEATTTEPIEQLDTPTNIQIVDNVITFDVVDHAVKYRLIVYNSESDELVGNYNITNGFDLSLLLQLGSYQYQLMATANGYDNSELSEKTAFDIVTLNQVSVLEGTEMNNINYIRWLGRTYYNPEEELTYFYFTASGLEVAFYGTELKVTLVATRYTDTSKQAYVVVLLDGEEDPTKGLTLVLDQAEAEYTLCSGLEYGYHTVKLLKRSEASDSDTAVASINTDGYFATAPAPKPFQIQYIAASSSTGYGNLGNLSTNKSTANSNGLLAYAYLTSYLLDSDTSIFAASGWGVSRGYNTGGSVSETQNIPNAFEYFAIDGSNTVFTAAGKWDFTDYIPDVVVINLGTNDFNASNYTSLPTSAQSEIEETYYFDYIDFIILLNNMYPNAKIIIAYGLMGEESKLGGITLDIIDAANDTIGTTMVYPFLMEAAGSNSNPYGCNYHPNVQTSMNVAEDLAEFIHTITGRTVVRDMITNE